MRRCVAQVRDVTAMLANEKGSTHVALFVYKNLVKKKRNFRPNENGSGASVMSK